MFHEGDIQSGIGLALQQSKAVLCFVQDNTETSTQWEEVLTEAPIASAVSSQAVALRLQASSQEAGFLSPICTINSTPAIIVIKNAQLQENLQSAEVSVKELKNRLTSAFGVQSGEDETIEDSGSMEPSNQPSHTVNEYLDLQPAPGQMRLPNNAYDALRNHTQKLLDEGTSPSEVFQTQLTLLNNMPIFHEEVERLRRGPRPELSEYARSRLLRLPAVGLRIPGQNKSTLESATGSQQQSPSRSNLPAPVIPAERDEPPSLAPRSETSSPAPNQTEIDKQKAQRADYIKMQREREQKQREERERIKAQIKADREERRRLDEMRKHDEMERSTSSAPSSSGSPRSKEKKTEVRVQVRTFDGSTLRSTFPPTSTLSADVRPWIDSSSNTTVPYNLKLILTPLPNRNIEASEEERELSDLGIVGSCTLVMVPVRGYVESYAGSTSGSLLGAAVSGGYNLISGTAGLVFGGMRSLLGYNNPAGEPEQSTGTSSPGRSGEGQTSTQSTSAKKVRVRTLADQRAEAQRDQQFYNGNQLNFEPKKDDDDKAD
ncbi:uncharacterized protein Z518_10714 [Rhinocladiella mackenziei CBS 650.93]|uniref:Rhinocladiella mackenziei CBS 650.93 unplaced genomic scaffold supercont1.10, whole genome shotgun sequence n=1 Tax=Rhinocladiella mackenziei CBS 650.93 TaxID=1442369 RepID=A0A0D2FCF4_9EURO|nr:uncharacterized protein Z518_10714 [Rhinocladiella mackenziei CBS 650.93]KIW99786.1 hypothetical protein Z518_10714 [Rhinocladiella mackenziei CBS 650.93]